MIEVSTNSFEPFWLEVESPNSLGHTVKLPIAKTVSKHTKRAEESPSCLSLTPIFDLRSGLGLRLYSDHDSAVAEDADLEDGVRVDSENVVDHTGVGSRVSACGMAILLS